MTADRDPIVRLRRTRRTAAFRELVRETRIHPRQLVAPIFVRPGSGVREPIGAMPGVDRVSPDEAVREVERLEALGVGGVILFGLPATKDATGAGAWVEDGIVQRRCAGSASRSGAWCSSPTRACASTPTTGTAASLAGDGSVDNDATVASLARTAVAQAAAGADVVAPSAMMDGQVAAIRRGLDAAGHDDRRSSPTPRRPRPRSTARSATRPTPPRRSATAAATRWTRPTAARRCARSDRPRGGGGRGPRQARARVAGHHREGARAIDVPLGAYHVSGEYAAIMAAARTAGWTATARTPRP